MSSTTILLVAPNRVKRDTPLGESVDDTLLQPCILTAQERWVHPTLGSDLFDKLKALINAGTLDDAGNSTYKKLLTGYVIPMLVQYSFAEVIPVLRMRFVNHGVVAMNGEQSTAVAYEEVKPIIHSATSIGDWYRERLIAFLESRTDLPEYTSNQFPDVQPTRRNYTQGLNVDPVYQSIDDRAIRQLLGIKV